MDWKEGQKSPSTKIQIDFNLGSEDGRDECKELKISFA